MFAGSISGKPLTCTGPITNLVQLNRVDIRDDPILKFGKPPGNNEPLIRDIHGGHTVLVANTILLNEESDIEHIVQDHYYLLV